MSQVEARKRAKAKKGEAALKIQKYALEVGRWFLFGLGLLVLALSGLSYMGGRGEGDLAIATKAVEDAQIEAAESKEALDEEWKLTLEAATSITFSELELVKQAKEEVVKFAKAKFDPAIPENYQLASFNPLLRSVNDEGKFDYVVSLEWKTSGEVTTTEKPDEIMYLTPPSPGTLFLENSNSDTTKRALVWFSIVDAPDEVAGKQITDLRGGPSTPPEKSK